MEGGNEEGRQNVSSSVKYIPKNRLKFTKITPDGEMTLIFKGGNHAANPG
jgi:hypothetical protein